jgi:hypothetical protein
LGPAEDSVEVQVINITDPDRLTRMLFRVLNAATWKEVLETP